jgi:tripartite-type tricarboxylate transporter receptor subunit TctC
MDQSGDADHTLGWHRDAPVIKITSSPGPQTARRRKRDEDHVLARRMAADFAQTQPATRVCANSNISGRSTMRRGLFFSVLAAMLLAAGFAHSEQNYPARQVRIIVPYPPGGPTDLIARLVAQRLGDRLGQSFVVENNAGASGAVGAGQVSHAAPDGYTLLAVTNDFAVASVTNKNLPYDPIKDFAPITMISTSPSVVAVNPNVPATTMKELVELIKAAPDKYNYAAMGIGFGQLSAERLFKLGLKLDSLPRVPFNGAAPAINATLAGDTPILMMGLPPVAPYLSAGKLRALAVTSATRSQAYPDIPTLQEAGVANQSSELVIGMVAPAGTPPEIIATLQKQIAGIIVLPEVKATIDKLSFQTIGSSPAEFAKAIKDDIAVWGKVMKDANIPVN